MLSTIARSYMFENDKIGDLTAVLNNSGIILYPTDTIWGLGCDATDPTAIERIFTLKKRERNRPLTILVDSFEMLKSYVEHVHPRIDNLLFYHTRPVTIVYDKGVNLPQSLLGPNGSVAVRLVKDNFCKQLIKNYGKPLVATTASISKQTKPTNFGSVSSEIIKGVDYVVRYRQNEKHGFEPCVIASISPRGELDFIRE